MKETRRNEQVCHFPGIIVFSTSPPTLYYLCDPMDAYFKSIILQATGASDLAIQEVIQELWSGYG